MNMPLPTAQKRQMKNQGPESIDRRGIAGFRCLDQNGDYETSSAKCCCGAKRRAWALRKFICSATSATDSGNSDSRIYRGNPEFPDKFKLEEHNASVQRVSF